MQTLHIILESAELSVNVLDKIKRLGNGVVALKCYLLCHNRFADRHYIEMLRGLWPSYEEQAEEKSQQLALRLGKFFVDVSVQTVFDRNWQSTIEKAVSTTDLAVIVRGENKQALSSAMASFISSVPFNVVVLGEGQWGKECKLLGAIDPFHEDDPQKEADKLVYTHLTRLHQRLKTASWSLVHVIYVPPLAIQYKKEIVDIHRQDTLLLCQQMRCSAERMKFLEGLPESALLSYTRRQQTDLLVVGSRKHSLLDKWLNGSTIEPLMASGLDIFIARRK